MIEFARPRPLPSASSVGSMSGAARWRRQRLEGLSDEIARLSAHIQAATGRLLDLIRDFDESERWYEEGFKSCALWLSWRTGIAPGAAREKVRVARALGGLPKLRAALGSGQLSYSVARALTRVATPENEAEFVEAARHSTAADLERLVGAWRAADRSEEDERERHERRYLRVTPDADGSWTVRGRLDPEVGAILRRALDAAGELLFDAERARADDRSNAVDEPDAENLSDDETSAEARPADAIGLVAEAAFRGNLHRASLGARAEEAPVVGRAERFQVVVHVSAETLASGAEAAEIEHGPSVSAETSRRLACDAGLVILAHDDGGRVLGVGRRRRTVPAALRRALDARDRGCRFPGCTSRFCDAHHVKHWARGGETALDNLLLLCRHHHRRVHEGGWRVTLGKTGEARFHQPDGQRLPRLAGRPTVHEELTRDLERANDRMGIEIGPWTATPRWTGERMDVDWALFSLRRPALPYDT